MQTSSPKIGNKFIANKCIAQQAAAGGGGIALVRGAELA